MKRKQLVALMLAGAMCINYNMAMAADYRFTDYNVLGGTAVAVGSVASTQFHGSTTLSVDGIAEVFVNVYTKDAEENEVYVGYAEDLGNARAYVDQTDRELPPVGTYLISKVDFTHGVYADANKVNRIFTYARTLQ